MKELFRHQATKIKHIEQNKTNMISTYNILLLGFPAHFPPHETDSLSLSIIESNDLACVSSCFFGVTATTLIVLLPSEYTRRLRKAFERGETKKLDDGDIELLEFWIKLPSEYTRRDRRR
mmetsp:Transcript_47940/g.61467  ORF Transcript_47940/g.61467 Transcript_47940/m.61467 type:complete len:120 (-) Transcript_47940:42-401(-)